MTVSISTYVVPGWLIIQCDRCGFGTVVETGSDATAQKRAHEKECTP